MPARVVLSARHGTISRSGARILFEFENAPLAELLASTGRAFSALVAAPEPGSRVLTVRFTADNPEEALKRIAEAAGLRLSGGAGAWILVQPGAERIPKAPSAEPFLKGGFSGAKGTP
jgi:hypothetical protein